MIFTLRKEETVAPTSPDPVLNTQDILMSGDLSSDYVCGLYILKSDSLNTSVYSPTQVRMSLIPAH